MLQLKGSTTSQICIPDRRVAMAERIRGEFREMPGLTLTLAQASRLWTLEAPTCAEVLSQLVEAGFLCRRSDGAFCRASDLAARPLRMAKAAAEPIDIEQRRRLAQA